MEILKLNLKTLKFFLLWPKDNFSWAGNTIVSVLHLIVILMSSSQTLAAMIYQFYVGIEDMNILSETFIGLSDLLGFIFIYFCFRKNHRLVKESIRKSSIFLKYCTPKVIKDAEEEVQTYTKGLLIHITAQIKHLRHHLLKVFEKLPEDSGCDSQTMAVKVKTKLKLCIKYHITIIDYTNQVFAAFNLMLIVHVSLTSLIFGVLGYQIVAVEDFTEKLRYVMHLGGWIALLFLTCYYGQLILDESTTVANAAYHSNWYNGPTYLRKNLCLIIMRSQRPLKLRAASIGVISLETFVSVIKTAYSYFALLLSIAE